MQRNEVWFVNYGPSCCKRVFSQNTLVGKYKKFVYFFISRYMLGLSAVPAVIQFFGFLFLPESPRWLIQKGQTQRARRILSQMRGNQAIDEEYDSIKNNIEEEEKEVGAGMLSAYWHLSVNEEMK